MSLYTPATAQWADPRHSIDTVLDSWVTWQTAPGAPAAWGTQYRVIYIPIRFPRRVIVKKLGIVTSTVSAGNVDLGVYNAAGKQLVSTGETATDVATVSVGDITDTAIGPGCFYLAANNDTTTDTFYALQDPAPILAARGVLTETLESLTLPATATWAFDQTLAFCPILSALLVTEVA